MLEYIKKILGSGKHNNTTTLIISNDEMDDISKIVKSLEVSGLLLKGVRETIQNETNEQQGGFLSMLLGTLGASLLGYILGLERSSNKKTWTKTCKIFDQKEFLMPPHPLTNFEIQKY